MSDTLKKIIIIVIFFLAVVGLAYLIYYLFFKPPPAEIPTIPPGQVLPSGQLPSISEGNVNRIINENLNAGLPSIRQIPEEAIISPVASGGYTRVNDTVPTNVTAPTLAKDNGLNYFNSTEGRFYKKSVDGSVTRMSDQRFYSVETVTWSPDGESAVLEYPDGSNILYDFNQNKQITLPKEFQDFAFTPSGQEIVAEVIGPQEENNWIVTANPDGSNIQFVERLGDQSANVLITPSPNSQVVALFRKNRGVDSQEVLFIGRSGENFKSLVTNGRGFEGQWTPQGDRLLYSVYSSENGFRPTLWSVEASGDNIGLGNLDLGLNTWSYKCAMAADNATAYCGVPDYLPEGSGIFPGLATDSFDSFYKVNLATGQRTLLAQPVGNQSGYAVQQIFLSSDEKVLYFQDEKTGGLYNINLE